MINSYKSRAIILHSIKHSESGHIIYMYTEQHARVTCYVKSMRNGRPVIGNSKITPQPLTIINYEGSTSHRSEFHRIINANRAYIPDDLFFNITKSSVALFISEVMYKIIRNADPDPLMFNFFVTSITSLDSLKSGEANFHLYFMVKLLSFLGFRPMNEYEEDMYFDMKNGTFVIIPPQHLNFFNREESAIFGRLLTISLSDLGEIKCSRVLRVSVLNNTIKYISLHHETNYDIVSLKILSEIF